MQPKLFSMSGYVYVRLVSCVPVDTPAEGELQKYRNTFVLDAAAPEQIEKAYPGLKVFFPEALLLVQTGTTDCTNNIGQLYDFRINMQVADSTTFQRIEPPKEAFEPVEAA